MFNTGKILGVGDHFYKDDTQTLDVVQDVKRLVPEEYIANVPLSES
jgi:hypothetical protein